MEAIEIDDKLCCTSSAVIDAPNQDLTSITNITSL